MADSPDTSDYMQQARKRFSAAKEGWKEVREDFTADARFASGNPAQQWDDAIKADRDNEGVPAITFDRTNPLVDSIVNAARKNGGQVKVTAGDDADPEGAEIIEGKLRHLQYACHSHVATDHAVRCAAMGGWGFYEIEKAYVEGRKPGSAGFYDKEPRFSRILDPTTSYPDPSVQEPDFSDAMYWFLRERFTREVFKSEFGKDPVPFPFDDDSRKEWGDEENVWVAKYYWVEIKKRRRVSLSDGTEGFADEISSDEIPPEFIVAERPVEERIVHCDIIDGEKKLEGTIVSAEWIPIIPVLGTEVVVDGVRRFRSAIRYLRDPQSFLNAAVSDVAMALGSASHSEWIGLKGSFKDGKWRDGKRHKYLEIEPVTIAGTPAPMPMRDNFEAPIAALTQAMAMAADGVKGAIGYVDSVTRPSQADLSGVATQRRNDQSALSNWQYQANLADSQWHGGRILLQMLIRETDTPRKWQVRKEDGTQRTVPVRGGDPTDSAGNPLDAVGYEGQPHLQVDEGEYILEITSGPDYATKAEAEVDTLMQILQAQPAMWPIYAPTVFKRLGYTDLEELARLAMPPQIQQALSANKQDPAVLQAQLLQAQHQIQQMQAVLKEALMKLQTKSIETQGKLDVERMRLIGKMVEMTTEHQHDAAVVLAGHHHAAAKHMIDLLHSTELAPNPNAIPQGATQ